MIMLIYKLVGFINEQRAATTIQDYLYLVLDSTDTLIGEAWAGGLSKNVPRDSS